MTEEVELINAKKAIEVKIKSALIKQNLTQEKLAKELNEGKQQLNRAIKGNTDPNSIRIRKEIYAVLHIN